MKISYFDQKHRRKIDMLVNPLTLFPDVINEIFNREALICCRSTNDALKKISYIEFEDKKMSFFECKAKYAMDLPGSFIVFKNCFCCFPLKFKDFMSRVAYVIGMSLVMLHWVAGVVIYFEWETMQNQLMLPDQFKLEQAKVWAVTFGTIVAVMLLCVRE